MSKETEAQRDTVERVMHAFKEGKLERGRGGKVRDPKQAVAIALCEAGASNHRSPAQNRKRLAETKAKEHAAGEVKAVEGTRASLYAEAARRGVPGRSRMRKAELAKALRA